MGRRSSFGQDLHGLAMVNSSGGWRKHGGNRKYTIANEITPTKTWHVEEKKITDAADSLLSLVRTRHLSAAASFQNDSGLESQNNATDNNSRQTNYLLVENTILREYNTTDNFKKIADLLDDLKFNGPSCSSSPLGHHL
eukprot:4921996-Ditylum_brightwellii.AAC.1